MQIGTWYESGYLGRPRSPQDHYFLPLEQLKHGGWSGILVDADPSRPRARPRAKKSSVRTGPRGSAAHWEVLWLEARDVPARVVEAAAARASATSRDAARRRSPAARRDPTFAKTPRGLAQHLAREMGGGHVYRPGEVARWYGVSPIVDERVREAGGRLRGRGEREVAREIEDVIARREAERPFARRKSTRKTRRDPASRGWSIGDAVQLHMPGLHGHGEVGTITEMRPRRIDGSIRYTVATPNAPQGMYVSEGMLRVPRSISRDPTRATTARGLARHVAREYGQKDLTTIDLQRDYGFPASVAREVYHLAGERGQTPARLEAGIMRILERAALGGPRRGSRRDSLASGIGRFLGRQVAEGRKILAHRPKPYPSQAARMRRARSDGELWSYIDEIQKHRGLSDAEYVAMGKVGDVPGYVFDRAPIPHVRLPDGGMRRLTTEEIDAIERRLERKEERGGAPSSTLARMRERRQGAG